MEDSEKRRERLKAMRAIADQAEACSNTVETPGLLANPLLETPEPPRPQEESFVPRFDYYTDPLGSFSSSNNKRDAAATYGGSSGHRVSSFPRPAGARYPEMVPSSGQQMQGNYSPRQQIYHAQDPYHGVNPTPYRSPRGVANPFPMNQGIPDMLSGYGCTSTYYGSPSPRGMTSPHMNQGNPHLRAAGSPRFSYGQGRSNWLAKNPGAGRGGSPTTSGRGPGQWQRGNTNPGFERRGYRGMGSPDCGSVADEMVSLESFYHTSMVEDPWQHLEPVMWRSVVVPANNLHAPDTSNSWLPKSIATKRARVSEAPNKASSRQSLAEFLAASFSEAVNDDPSA